jgi:hypothetical protein
VPQIEAMISVFELQMVEHSALRGHLCSRMTFDFVNATFRAPKSTAFVVHNGAVPGLGDFNVSTGSFLSGVTGAVFFEADWKMGKPLQEC